ncbi:MAG: ornithine--oxo-acid transaminase [Anaerolineales bacterium]
MSFMKANHYINLEKQYGANNYAPLDVVITKGEGVWVEDVDGNRYLDCLSAYSAVNQGHCHPRIVKTLIEQAQKLQLTSRAFRNDQLGPFYEQICQLTGYEMALPMNTGAEAVETALKAARKWGYTVKGVPDGKAEIITCDGNFHGRTVTVISFSSEEQYREGFGPYTPGFVNIPYGDIEALRSAINSNTVAFLVEPIQGEGGILVPSEGYLKAAHDLCAEQNVLLTTDEIQTGLGRTGKLFASDHEDVRPDLMILGKALSGGAYPISVVLSSAEILGVFNPGDHGSTYGGNPLGCAVAQTALEVLVEEKMIENSAQLGDYFQDKLRSISSPHIKEVRGKGLLVGLELKPEAGGGRRFCEALQVKGVLAKTAHTNVIRFAPPLIITKEDLDWALEIIEEVLTSI